MDLRNVSYNFEQGSYSDGFTTTFWRDFCIAEECYKDKQKIINAIKDTFERCKTWQTNIRYWTDLCMVLNHKIWRWYEDDKEIAQVYDELWREADEFVFTKSNFTDEEKEFYVRITD